MVTHSQVRTTTGRGADAEKIAYRGNVISFGSNRPSHPHLTTRDRMVALDWATRSETHGYCKIIFDTAGEWSGHEPGDFMLIYARSAEWASWGIGCVADGLALWQTSCGTTRGVFATMDETLAAVPCAAGRN